MPLMLCADALAWVCYRQDFYITLDLPDSAPGMSSTALMIATLLQTIFISPIRRVMGTADAARYLLPMMLRTAEVPASAAAHQQVSFCHRVQSHHCNSELTQPIPASRPRGYA
jgi:hypothetical protein